MKILVQNVHIHSPQMCSACGASEGRKYFEYQVRSESRSLYARVQAVWTFLRCESCMAYLREWEGKFQAQILRGLAIGFGVSLIVLLIVTGLLISLPDLTLARFRANLSGLPWLVPWLILILLVALSALAGWIGYRFTRNRALRNKKLPAEVRARLGRILEPIKVVRYYSSQEKGMGPAGYLEIIIEDTTFGRKFAELNHALIVSMNCAKCGAEIEEQKDVLGRLKGWNATVCLECKKAYCPNCLDPAKPQLCPEAGHQTLPAGREAVAKAGLIAAEYL